MSLNRLGEIAGASKIKAHHLSSWCKNRPSAIDGPKAYVMLLEFQDCTSVPKRAFPLNMIEERNSGHYSESKTVFWETVLWHPAEKSVVRNSTSRERLTTPDVSQDFWGE